MTNEASSNEIAIIGMAGRFPGARTLNEYYQNLRDGLESITFFSDEQLRSMGVSQETLADPNYVKAAPVLQEAEYFDADFFNYSVREARMLDPQQRCLLECAWQALENAGYSAEQYDYPIGVFAGTSTNTYLLDNIINKGVAVDLDFMNFIGTYLTGDKDFLATRVSYKLNLTGPSFTLQSACSTSLVAVHTACQNLLNGECDMALAGAVTIRFPVSGYIYKPDGMVSPDGHCRAFDAQAQGTLFGSGLGVVVLKRLSDALEDGDHILAVIKGSALNNDGAAKLSYTAPSLDRQSDVVGEALAVAEVEPESIGYIEAHGTGTPLGDPVEIAALSQVHREYTDRNQYCAIGSVKTNIGHLDVAAGMAGLIKLILMLQHKQIFPSLHFTTPNPKFDLANSPFYVNTKLSPFQAKDGQTLCRAAMTSLGVGGTNAHLILEEAPTQRKSSPSTRLTHLLPLSAKSQAALDAASENLRDFLSANPTVELADVAYTLKVGRISFPYRRVLLCYDVQEAIELLEHPSTEQLLGAGGADHASVDSLHSLANRWLSGETIDWQEFYAQEKRHRIPLPTYPFERQRYNFSQQQAVQRPIIPSQSLQQTSEHPLLHKQIHSPAIQKTIFESSFSLETLPYLDDHRVHGLPITPGAFHVSMILSAAIALKGDGPQVLQNIVFKRALFLPESGGRLVQLILDHSDSPKLGLQLHSKDESSDDADGDWSLHSQASMLNEVIAVRSERVSLQEIQSRCREEVSAAQFYDFGQQIGFEWGPDFQCIQKLWRRDGEALAQLYHPTSLLVDLEHYPIHPAILDACLQPYMAALPKDGPQIASGDVYVPLTINHLTYYRQPTQTLWVHVQVRPDESRTQGSFAVDITIVNDDGTIAMSIDGLRLLRAEQTTLLQSSQALLQGQLDFIYKPTWTLTPAPPALLAKPKCVVIVGHEQDEWHFADRLAASQAYSAARVIRIKLGTHQRGGEMATGRGGETATAMATAVYPSPKEAQPRPLPHSLPPPSQKPPDFEVDYRRQADFDAIAQEIPAFDTIYFLGGMRRQADQDINLDILEESQQVGVLALFRLVKAFLSQGRSHPYHLKIVTNDLQFVKATDTHLYPLAGGLIGFGKVFAKENPTVKVSCLDLASNDLSALSDSEEKEGLLLRIIDEPGQKNVAEVALRRTMRFVKRLVKVQDWMGKAREGSALRAGGVYLILGGAGGVGSAVSNFLAETWQASIVLVGRRPLDAALEGKLTEIRQLGGDAIYCQADGTDVEQMTEVVRTAKATYGRLNGVIHSAIVLRDQTLLRMDEANFRIPFDAKVKTSVVLYEVTKEEPLDFYAFFSTENVFRGRAGQSNYAAGSTFKDAFATYLKHNRKHPVTIFNWGYWGEIGIVASAEYRAAMQREGMYPLSTQEGLSVFEMILGSPIHQAVPLKIDESYADQIGLSRHARLMQLDETTTLGGIETVETHLKRFANAHPYPADHSPWLSRLQEMGRYQALKVLQELGGKIWEASTVDVQELMAMCQIEEKHDSLISALVDILARMGLIESIGERFRFTDRARYEAQVQIDRYARDKEALLANYPDARAWFELLDVSLSHFSQILRGEVKATSVLFLNGSVELVEGIYRGNVLSDYCNQLVAESIRAMLDSLISQKPVGEKIFILEFGGGTGSTTSEVLQAISKYGEHIEYLFTDISPRFTQRAQERFGAHFPFVNYQLFDMERSPQAQGLPLGKFDIVLGTNVIHVCEELSQTIDQLKQLLKKNGYLIINELTQVNDLLTLTFGLLDGWWLYKDATLRLPYAPLLDGTTWQYLLQAKGFSNVRLYPQATDQGSSPQHVILAQSDGALFVTESIDVQKAKSLAQGGAATGQRVNSNQSRQSRTRLTRQEIEQAPFGQRHELLSQCLREQLIETLQLNPTVAIDMDQPLGKIGLDSLISIDFCAALAKTLQTSIPTTLVFDHPSLGAMVDFIAQDVFDWTDTESSVADSEQEVEEDEFDTLSPEEIEALLLEELMK